MCISGSHTKSLSSLNNWVVLQVSVGVINYEQSTDDEENILPPPPFSFQADAQRKILESEHTLY